MVTAGSARGDPLTGLTLSRERHGVLADCLAARAEPVAQSARFTLYDLKQQERSGRDPDGIILVHDFAPSEIDNNIAGFVAYELMPLLVTLPPPGAQNGYVLSEQETFERLVGAIVRSADDSERRAWHLFYDNTLSGLDRAGRQLGATDGDGAAPEDFIATFAAIYDRAFELIAEAAPQTWLDAATCFGFLPFHLTAKARAGTPDHRWPPEQIFACDVDDALVSLAQDYARHTRLTNLCFFRADLLASDLAPEGALVPPRCDVVTAIHVLEHLEPAPTTEALAALWSRTGRRLIVAVPIEDTPDPRFGHRQVFDLPGLMALGQTTGGSCRCFEDHGAWLVIDRLPQKEPGPKETG